LTTLDSVVCVDRLQSLLRTLTQLTHAEPAASFRSGARG